MAEAFDWPHLIGRFLMSVLVLGFPLVLTLAWYHGHKGLKRVGHGELGIMSLLLVIAAGLLVVFVRTPGQGHSPAPAVQTARQDVASAPETVTATPTGISLAVLPFADMSPAHDQEYYSDGLTEEILNQLAQIKDLTVIGRTSSFSFKGKNEDLRVIAEKLGVGNLLEGSIRKDRNQLRITAQLVNGKSGAHLWSKTYDRELKDVFAVQEQIARDVAQVLSIRLDVGEMNRAHGGTTNLEAYDRYLRGFAEFRQAALEQAAAHFREAVAIDPDFTEAWWTLYATLDATNPSDPEKSEAMRRLQELAPGSWRALLARGIQMDSSHNWSEAQSAFEAALTAEDVSFATPVEAYYSIGLRKVGRVQKVHELWKRVVKAEPLAIAVSAFMQYDLLALNRDGEWLAELERSKTLVGYQGGSERDLLNILAHGNTESEHAWGRYRGAVNRDALLQSLFARRTDPAAARAALHRIFDNSANSDAGRIADWADYFADKDLALAALQRFSESKNFTSEALWQPYKTNLRTDPRFKALVNSLGLVDYWRSSGNWGDFCNPVGEDDFECH